MHLWILRPITGDEEKGSWDPWYNKVFGFVVRARNEKQARELASKIHYDEGAEAWLDREQSVCVPITHEGRPEVIMRNLWMA